MIAFPRTSVPVPDAVASRIGHQYPDRVQAAIGQAADAVHRLHLCRIPRYEEGRQNALAEWNPRTVYGPDDLPQQLRRKGNR